VPPGPEEPGTCSLAVFPAGRRAKLQQHPVLEGDVLAAGLIQLFGQLVEPLVRRLRLS
jgi:hypothetical protein